MYVFNIICTYVCIYYSESHQYFMYFCLKIVTYIYLQSVSKHYGTNYNLLKYNICELVLVYRIPFFKRARAPNWNKEVEIILVI